ncbi:MAG: undecaprenyldiphospho-muramoylpentapeptide beta-N-acetylglucosaminyltransferase [Bacteroidales bacterium]|nr:undecaprenyldiphospho-muramoylpentapeptide beta-N-acetylglucosaminyltransferase [Bacteroidales bacterium]
MKAIISGGGSGGHIFPAVAIANAIKRRWPDAEILFVGAQGRMEMEKVPAAGYEIKGLPIAGLQRKITLTNLVKNAMLPYKVIKSRLMVRGIIKKFNPDIVVGVGGFASEPTLKTASAMGYTTLIQEQNSYAGLTNKTLAKKAAKICVAYDNMERFFPKERIVFTGNPVRKEIEELSISREDGRKEFDLDNSKRVVLSVGGSLGARSINEMILKNLDYFKQNDIQLIWQTGRWMYKEAVSAVESQGLTPWVKVYEFVSKMDYAYAAADAVVSRAGAIAISELCLVGKPVILIPSPNVAEDHQTKNAMSLANKGAAEVVADKLCGEKGIEVLDKILKDEDLREKMSANIKKLGVRHSADLIVDEIEKLIK